MIFLVVVVPPIVSDRYTINPDVQISKSIGGDAYVSERAPIRPPVWTGPIQEGFSNLIIPQR